MQVEKAPTVVKAGLKKEEAEELQKKLEAGVSACACAFFSMCILHCKICSLRKRSLRRGRGHVVPVCVPSGSHLSRI